MKNRMIRSTHVVFLSAVLLFTMPACANKLSDAMSSDTWLEEADELLLEADGTLRGDAEKQVEKAWKKMRAGEVKRFRLALKVQSYIEKGFNEELAAQYADDALLTTNYGTLSLNTNDKDNMDKSAAEKDSGPAADAYTDDTSAVSDLIACRKNAELSEVFARILETADGSHRKMLLLEELGQVLQGEDRETALTYALQAEDAGWDGEYLLLQVWTPDQSPEDTAADICAVEDDLQRSLLIKTAGLSFVEPDEILRYISSCAQMGTAPSDCYPEGVDFPLDLSGLNQNAVSRGNIDQTKFLILSRNETIPKPSAYNILSLLSSSRSNHPDPENCKIRLETGWMDMIPAEHFPSSLDEVNTVLLMDNQYFFDGTMSVETTTSLGGEQRGSSTNEYQLYSAVQVNSCFDWPSQSLLYSFSGQYTAPPEVPEEDREDTSYGLSLIPDMVRKYYRADMDPAWAEDNMREHLNTLLQNSWDTDVSVGIERFSAVSEANWDQILHQLYP